MGAQVWPPRLTKQDVVEAAKTLGVEPAALAAVAAVESSGYGFLPDGRPKMLFEGHVFWRRLRLRGIDPEPVAAQHPDICYPAWTGRWYLGGAPEYRRYERAKAIHAEAAIESASWGMFQLLGMNYRAAGFSGPQEFLAAHKRSEREHLDAICRWMTSNGLAKVLRAKDWQAFARGYNGPGQVDVYSDRLKRAYERCVARGWNAEVVA
jgi:hypothetical protein